MIRTFLTSAVVAVSLLLTAAWAYPSKKVGPYRQCETGKFGQYSYRYASWNQERCFRYFPTRR